MYRNTTAEAVNKRETDNIMYRNTTEKKNLRMIHKTQKHKD
jgi:hypothetical protein